MQRKRERGSNRGRERERERERVWEGMRDRVGERQEVGEIVSSIG